MRGRADAFDVAMAEFAAAYADKEEADFKRFVDAVKDQRVEVDVGV